MTTPAPDQLLTLDQAATLVPGADASTLKRRIRQGKLVATRPGKAYLTTAADIARMVEACRVVPKGLGSISAPRAATLPVCSRTPEPGSSEVLAASTALDSALTRLKQTKPER